MAFAHRLRGSEKRASTRAVRRACIARMDDARAAARATGAQCIGVRPR
jgi:hypothetical protein